MAGGRGGSRVRGCGGFTLLEVLVALAILGIGLGVIFQGLGMGMRLRREAAQGVRLAVAAERILGALPTRKAAPTEIEEGEAEGCRWRLEPIERKAELVGGVAVQRGAELVEVRLILTPPSGPPWEMTTLLPLARPETAAEAAR